MTLEQLAREKRRTASDRLHKLRTDIDQHEKYMSDYIDQKIAAIAQEEEQLESLDADLETLETYIPKANTNERVGILYGKVRAYTEKAGDMYEKNAKVQVDLDKKINTIPHGLSVHEISHIRAFKDINEQLLKLIKVTMDKSIGLNNAIVQKMSEFE